MRVALLGANGFIGARAVEKWRRGPNDLRPVVRRYAGLARLSRFELDYRIADSTDQSAMAEALAGCDVAVDCVVSDAKRIPEVAVANYRAANRAGVRRFVYLSSASVYGQNPAAGVDERTPLVGGQWHWYNNAKIEAENALRRERKSGTTDLVILRPGVVWGPRCGWVTGFVEALMSGRAWIVDDGNGVLNSIYIDNLLYAIELCFDAPKADREAFIVQDDQAVCWRDLYRPLCQAMGMGWKDVIEVGRDATAPRAERSVVDRAKAMPLTRVVAPLVPRKAKRMAKAALGALREAQPDDPYALPAKPGPEITEEFLRLFTCAWRFPDDKARSGLGYRAALPFEQSLQQTIKWLRWAGYPVEAADDGPH